MPTFIRLGSSTIWICSAVLSIALPASGTPIASSVDDRTDSSTSARIVVAKPNGGQIVVPRNRYTIRWFAQGIDTVRIEYSVDRGSTWLLIGDAVQAVAEANYRCPDLVMKRSISSAIADHMGSYAWDVPDMESGEVLIRILDKLRPSISDVSDKPFAIAQRVSSGWTTQSVGSPVSLFSVSTVDDSIAWTCGWHGVVFRTTNGGSSWIQGTSLPTDGTGIFGLNADTAFVCVNVGNDGRIYRTTNGGISWAMVYQYTGEIVNVHMFGARKGVAIGNAVGGLWRILKTTNYGLTWGTLSEIQESQHGYENAVAWISEEKGWFGTDGGTPPGSSLVYHTTDGGLTWAPTYLGSLDVFALQFPNNELGMASTAFRNIYKTTNGGSSWSYASQVPGAEITLWCWIAGIDVPTPRWWATNMDEIYRSTDHGMTWVYEAILDGYPINDLSMNFVEHKRVVVGYAVGAGDGAVMRYSELVTSVPEEKGNPLPVKVVLEQNYPNPFNPTTTISFQLTANSFVTLKVYDVLGREVATLVNEAKLPGTYSVQWDAAGVASGVYFYKLQAGKFVETKKLLLLR
jgi:photosystem II stability/assembly factor-like uncharacterized protein